MEVLEGYVAICHKEGWEPADASEREYYMSKSLFFVDAASCIEAIERIRATGYVIDTIDTVSRHIINYIQNVPECWSIYKSARKDDFVTKDPIWLESDGIVDKCAGESKFGSMDAVDVCMCIFILCMSALLFVMMLRFLFL